MLGGMETTEQLETGYGATTPAGDNLHNDFAQGEAEAFGALARARGDRIGEFEEFGLVLTDSGSPTPFGNVAVLRRPLHDSEWAGAARVMQHFYAHHDGGPFMLFSAWPTADLHTYGYGLVGHPPMMFRPPAPHDVAPIDGFEIRTVDDAATAREWEEAIVHGYPVPELQPFTPGCFLPEAALAAKGWTHFVGYLDNRPVATGSAFSDAQHVHVEFVSTLDAARGRGVGRAITAAATLVEPTLPAMLIASDLGRPVYDRLGYRPLLRYTLWIGHRS
jgi:hypothetical protein